MTLPQDSRRTFDVEARGCGDQQPIDSPCAGRERFSKHDAWCARRPV